VEPILEITFDSYSDKIQFTASLEEWTAKYVIIHLNFTDPLNVSSGRYLDKIMVKVLMADLFRSKQSLKVISSENKYFEASFPKQLPIGVFEVTLVSQAQAAKTSMNSAAFVNVSAQGFFKFLLDYLINTLNELQ
jgi:hypothetical protein